MKKVLAGGIAVTIVGFSILFWLKFSGNKSSGPAISASPMANSSAKIEDVALKNALNLYIKKKEENVDFSNGPCLGIIAEDWVLDIAHNPRVDVDNMPENQCADFREGRAHHFIELDLYGKLIRSF